MSHSLHMLCEIYKEEYAMKKKFLSILLVLCMVLGMMPTAFADDVAASGNAA